MHQPTHARRRTALRIGILTAVATLGFLLGIPLIACAIVWVVVFTAGYAASRFQAAGATLDRLIEPVQRDSAASPPDITPR